MARPIYDDNQRVIGYEPGIIYELVYDGQPFYVGETTDAGRRLAEHQRAGRDPENNPETKYQFIAALDAAGLEWTMREVVAYGLSGPEELEDEHIMALLYDGVALTNEKKGNANWMQERQTVAQDMRDRGLRSYREYRRVLTQEQARAAQGTASPKQHPEVDRVIDQAWNASLQPEKTRRSQAVVDDQPRRDAIAEETLILTKRFPIEDQIELLQGLLLTWNQHGCSDQLRQRTEQRLALLQESAK
jgi:hypothetical protein